MRVILSQTHVDLPCDRGAALPCWQVYQPKEIEMRQNVLSILGVLVIAALTVQMATAAPSRARKAARGHAPAIHRFLWLRAQGSCQRIL